MNINAIPEYDVSDNPTNCCPRFKPEGWSDQELHFKDKLFVKAETRSLFHVPLNMGVVFPKVINAIETANARAEDQYLVMSYDRSPWSAEHYFAVTKDVPDQTMVLMSGNYLTKVFEGPYKKAPEWEKKMQEIVKQGSNEYIRTYFFYTTCPKCAKFYGKNYVVAVTEVK